MANGDSRPPQAEAARPTGAKRSGSGALLVVLGIVIMVATAIACVAYGVSQMQPGMDPMAKARLRSTVRLIGTIPMLAGIVVLILGIRKSKAAKQPRP